MSRYSASWNACSTSRRGSVAARSQIVRATVVIRIPRIVATSTRGRWRGRCSRMPGCHPGFRPTTVTSTAPPAGGSSPTSSAAERWLSTAPSPQANIAARACAMAVGGAAPSRYTPRCNHCIVRACKRRAIAPRPSPASNNWSRVITLSCRRATAAIARSTACITRHASRPRAAVTSYASPSCTTRHAPQIDGGVTCFARRIRPTPASISPQTRPTANRDRIGTKF